MSAAPDASVEIRNKSQYERTLDKLSEMYGDTEQLMSPRFDRLSAAIEKYEVKEGLSKAA